MEEDPEGAATGPAVAFSGAPSGVTTKASPPEVRALPYPSKAVMVSEAAKRATARAVLAPVIVE